jgi:hypothetical protein
MQGFPLVQGGEEPANCPAPLATRPSLVPAGDPNRSPPAAIPLVGSYAAIERPARSRIHGQVLLEKFSDSSAEAGHLSFDERLRPRSKWPEPGPAIPGVLTGGGEEICHKPLQERAHPTATARERRHGSIPSDSLGRLTRSASEGNPGPRLRFGLVRSMGRVREVLPKPAHN